MKTKILVILTTIILFTSCKSQTAEPVSLASYPNFYNQTVTRLNNIIPNKTNYYGQPLSLFIQALTQNNLAIKAYDAGPFNNKLLKLIFINDSESIAKIRGGDFAIPYINIYFQQPYDFQQATIIMNQYHWYWNTTSENFYKNLIIEKIEFYYVNGLTDKSNPPK